MSVPDDILGEQVGAIVHVNADGPDEAEIISFASKQQVELTRRKVARSLSVSRAEPSLS
jgi:hypothetical protein